MKIQKLLIPILLIIAMGACTVQDNNRNNSNANSGGSTGGGGGTTDPGTGGDGSDIPNTVARADATFYTTLLNGEIQTALAATSLPSSTRRSADVFRGDFEDTDLKNLGLNIFNDSVTKTPSVVEDTIEDIAITRVGSSTYYSVKTVTTRRGRTPNNTSQEDWDNHVILQQYGDLIGTADSSVRLVDDGNNPIATPQGFSVLRLTYQNNFSIRTNLNNTGSIAATYTHAPFASRNFAVLISSNQNGAEVRLQIIPLQALVEGGSSYRISGKERTYTYVEPTGAGAFPLDRKALSEYEADFRTGGLGTPFPSLSRDNNSFIRESSRPLFYRNFTFDNILRVNNTYTNDVIERIVYQPFTANAIRLRSDVVVSRRGFAYGPASTTKKIWSNDVVSRINSFTIYDIVRNPELYTDSTLTRRAAIQADFVIVRRKNLSESVLKGGFSAVSTDRLGNLPTRDTEIATASLNADDYEVMLIDFTTSSALRLQRIRHADGNRYFMIPNLLETYEPFPDLTAPSSSF